MFPSAWTPSNSVYFIAVVKLMTEFFCGHHWWSFTDSGGDVAGGVHRGAVLSNRIVGLAVPKALFKFHVKKGRSRTFLHLQRQFK
jgi:hypothetical protein